MSLLDVAAADLAIALGDWGTAAVLRPDGVALSAPVVLMVSEPADTFIETAAGSAQERRAQAIGSAAALRAALAAIGLARAPRRADVVEIATGDFAGSWTIDTATPNAGGRLVLGLVAASRRSAHAPGLMKGGGG